MGMTDEEREKHIRIANMLIGVITDLERPMLMYQIEKDVTKEALENYIKVLEQQSFINKPCVSEGACREDKIQVLDKIRAEIEEYKSRQLTLAIGVEDLEKGKQIALEYVLAIIDKYMKESENE